MYATISARISVTKEQIKKAQVQCGFALQSAGFDCDGYSDSTLRFSVDGEEYSSWSLEPFGVETILVFTDEPPHNSDFRMMAFSLIRDAGSSEWILAGDILALTQDEWDDLLNDGIQGDLKLLALTTSKQSDTAEDELGTTWLVLRKDASLQAGCFIFTPVVLY